MDKKLTRKVATARQRRKKKRAEALSDLATAKTVAELADALRVLLA